MLKISKLVPTQPALLQENIHKMTFKLMLILKKANIISAYNQNFKVNCSNITNYAHIKNAHYSSL